MTTCMHRAAFVALLGGLSLAGTQAPPPPTQLTDAPIVVEGARLTPEQERERAVAFIRGAGIAGGDTPVARWVDPVCIDVVGIGERHAQIVETRMRQIAEAAGIGLAAPDCRPNVEVRFTADSNQELQRFVTGAPRRLSQVTGAARERLLAGPEPVRWWYSIGLRDRYNMGTNSAPPAWMNFAGRSGTGPGAGMPTGVPGTLQYGSSMVSSQGIRALEASTVIVDISRFERMPLDGVAAYAAMVALAEIRQSDFTSEGSILGLFARGGAMPRALTSWDLALLRALYRLPLDRTARRHRGILLRDLLAAADTEPRP